VETSDLGRQPKQRRQVETSDLGRQPKQRRQVETSDLGRQPKQRRQVETSDLGRQPKQRRQVETSDLGRQPKPCLHPTLQRRVGKRCCCTQDGSATSSRERPQTCGAAFLHEDTLLTLRDVGVAGFGRRV
jgi:hypothetical protein